MMNIKIDKRHVSTVVDSSENKVYYLTFFLVSYYKTLLINGKEEQKVCQVNVLIQCIKGKILHSESSKKIVQWWKKFRWKM